MRSWSAAPITLETTQEVLHDLLRANDRRVTIEEIQKRVAEHFNIKIADMHSARRARAVARPRQVAMYLAKQLTSRSLPEIGRKFGGRDHTTVMHAVRKIEELRATDAELRRGCRAACAGCWRAEPGRLSPHADRTRMLDRPTGFALSLFGARFAIVIDGFRTSVRVARIGRQALVRSRRPGRPRRDVTVHCRETLRSQPAMKLTIERGALLKSLAHVQSVVERRNTIPILSNVLLEAGGRCAGADRDRHGSRPSSSGCRPRSAPAGATTVPAHTLYDIVRKLPEGAQVELDGAGDARPGDAAPAARSFTLPTLPPEDFPAMAGGELPHQLLASPAEDLRSLIDRTRFAISTEETRYYLNGIYLHAHHDRRACKVLRAVATDGHRLARVEMALPAGRGRHARRHRAAQDGGRAAQADRGDRRSESRSRSPTPRSASPSTTVLLTSKLIDGTFPDYERVIPTGNDKILEVDCKELRRGGRPRLDDLDREDPGGEAGARRRAR